MEKSCDACGFNSSWRVCANAHIVKRNEHPYCEKWTPNHTQKQPIEQSQPEEDCEVFRKFSFACSDDCIEQLKLEPKQPEKKPLVVIPSEVSEAIYTVRFYNEKNDIGTFTNWSMIKHGFSNLIYETLRNYFVNHPHEYIDAIRNGYQVDMTPKEQILELLEEAKKDEENAILRADELSVRYYQGSIYAFAKAIKIMGWEVK